VGQGHLVIEASRSHSDTPHSVVEWKRDVMAHAHKLDLVFQRNGRVHLYRRGCQFSRVLAFLEWGSGENDCSRSNTGWTVPSQTENCWLPTSFASFPFTSPTVRHRVPSDSVSTLLLWTSDQPVAETSTWQNVTLATDKHPRVRGALQAGRSRFYSRWCHCDFSLTQSFRPHYGPGVDTDSNRNEYQEYLLRVKASGA